MAKQQSETLYTARMRHNAGTIEKLVLMQYNTFQLGKKAIRIVIAGALMAYGVFTYSSGMITSYFCLFLGCVMIAGLNVRPKLNAKNIIKQINGRYPSSDYFFSARGFRDGENCREIPYSSLIKTVDDRSYLYLYVSSESAYMVNSSTVTGEGGIEGLRSLIVEKSGQKWVRPNSFWRFNIESIRELAGNRDAPFRGERLGDRRR